MKKRNTLFFLTLPLAIFSMGSKVNQPLFNNEAIGVHTYKYEDKDRKRPVTVEFWYPTDEEVAQNETSQEEVWIHPKEARDAKLSEKRASYPLIMMSHGYRGDRRERTWLVDSLVRQGFVVASVDHFGNVWNQFDPIASLCFWDRAKDISFAISAVLEEPDLKMKINQTKIGFVGYSMGGMTGLALAGAQAHHVKEIVKKTSDVSIPEPVLSTIDFAEAEKNYRDPRIRSMLLICPAAFAYMPDSLKQIKVPIGIIASLDDEVLPHKEHAHKIIKYVIPHRVKILRNKASHYAFLNRMTEKGYKVLQKVVSSSSVENWIPIQREATAFTLKFFQETL
jgi:predicted dienelactone hydrolase